MPQLHRVIINWSGGPVVGKAVSVLHYDANNAAAPPVAAIRDAFQTNQALFNQDVHFDVVASGDVIDDHNGTLTGSWNVAGGPFTTSGNSPQPSAGGVGGCISWTSSTLVTGKKGPRRLRGRTFLVPFTTGCYDTDGTLTPQALTTATALANALLAAGPLMIWHRPTTVGGQDGTSGPVDSARVRDKVAFLSSRRD